jgi:hypothetical protein
MKSPHTFEIVIDGLKIDMAANVKHSHSSWLLCLHGLQSNKQLFDGFFEQQLASGFSVLALDLVGFGKSSKPDEFSYDIQDQANVVVEVVRMLDVQSLHIIGHSLGGMIGTLLLNPLKDVVRSFVNMEGNLILADCGLSNEVSQCRFSRFQSHEFDRIKTSLRQSQAPGSIGRAKCLDEVPAFAFYETCQSIVQWSSTGKLLQVFSDACCCKLFVHGSATRKKAACLTGVVETTEIPSSGHFMLQDNPTACYKTIHDFLVAVEARKE